jgi:hypothetical protein
LSEKSKKSRKRRKEGRQLLVAAAGFLERIEGGMTSSEGRCFVRNWDSIPFGLIP